VLPAGAKAVMEVRPRQSERAAAWAFMVEMDGCVYDVVREEAERSTRGITKLLWCRCIIVEKTSKTSVSVTRGGKDLTFKFIGIFNIFIRESLNITVSLTSS
jgi:hypothetical protein